MARNDAGLNRLAKSDLVGKDRPAGERRTEGEERRIDLVRVQIDGGVAERLGQLVGLIGSDAAGQFVGKVLRVVRREWRFLRGGNHRGEAGGRESRIGGVRFGRQVRRALGRSLVGVFGAAEGKEPHGLGLRLRRKRFGNPLRVCENPLVFAVAADTIDDFDGTDDEAAREVLVPVVLRFCEGGVEVDATTDLRRL